MLEQAQKRRLQVCQELLRYKSDESVQEEQLAAEKENQKAVSTRLSDLGNAQTECE